MKPVIMVIMVQGDPLITLADVPVIKHDFAKQLLSYQLTAMLIENGSTRLSSKYCN